MSSHSTTSPLKRKFPGSASAVIASPLKPPKRRVGAATEAKETFYKTWTQFEEVARDVRQGFPFKGSFPVLFKFDFKFDSTHTTLLCSHVEAGHVCDMPCSQYQPGKFQGKYCHHEETTATVEWQLDKNSSGITATDHTGASRQVFLSVAVADTILGQYADYIPLNQDGRESHALALSQKSFSGELMELKTGEFYFVKARLAN